MSGPKTPAEYVAALRASGFSIYDKIDVSSNLYIPTTDLESLLNQGLKGFSVVNMPPRTRSKEVKARICHILGYPTPVSFKRTNPRFPGQNFDTYVQKAFNLQIWNEEVSALRRYVVIQEKDQKLARVRVITGETLAELDTTGTLTQKYQARLVIRNELAELISGEDTPILRPMTGIVPVTGSPIDRPVIGQILPIGELFTRLRGMIGRSFPDAGRDQDRNRGAALHKMVCEAIGYDDYGDDGQFPDLKAQLLEVKLQTASTIDLGLVTPDSTKPIELPLVGEVQLRHCDARYAIFDAMTDGSLVTIRRVFLTTGADFFTRFPRFEGKVLNRKRQIPLPRDFFRNTEGLFD